jgi:hypothetical protein
LGQLIENIQLSVTMVVSNSRRFARLKEIFQTIGSIISPPASFIKIEL